MKKYDEDKDTVLRFRLPSAMKEDLQYIAQRRNLNLSQFLRNYVEDVINAESEPDGVLALRERIDTNAISKPLGAHSEAFYTVRCSKMLQHFFRQVCIKEGFKPSGYLRTFMLDFTELMLHCYWSTPAPLADNIEYLEIVLKNEEAKKGHMYLGLEAHSLYMDDDSITRTTPIIEQLDELHYRINDVSSKIYYILKFTDKVPVKEWMASPFETQGWKEEN